MRIFLLVTRGCLVTSLSSGTVWERGTIKTLAYFLLQSNRHLPDAQKGGTGRQKNEKAQKVHSSCLLDHRDDSLLKRSFVIAYYSIYDHLLSCPCRLDLGNASSMTTTVKRRAAIKQRVAFNLRLLQARNKIRSIIASFAARPVTPTRTGTTACFIPADIRRVSGNITRLNFMPSSSMPHFTDGTNPKPGCRGATRPTRYHHHHHHHHRMIIIHSSMPSRHTNNFLTGGSSTLMTRLLPNLKAL
jgi:hypothetical protein